MACDDAAATCLVSQTTMGADQTWLGTVQLVIRKSGPTEIPIVFTVPEGVHLASGLFFADGSGAPRQANWLRCETGACIATGTLDADGLRAWQRGTTAELRYRPRRAAPAIAAEVSLLGVTAALSAAKEAVR